MLLTFRENADVCCQRKPLPKDEELIQFRNYCSYYCLQVLSEQGYLTNQNTNWPSFDQSDQSRALWPIRVEFDLQTNQSKAEQCDQNNSLAVWPVRVQTRTCWPIRTDKSRLDSFDPSEQAKPIWLIRVDLGNLTNQSRLHLFDQSYQTRLIWPIRTD